MNCNIKVNAMWNFNNFLYFLAKLFCLSDNAHFFIVFQLEQTKTLIFNVAFLGVVRKISVKYSDSQRENTREVLGYFATNFQRLRCMFLIYQIKCLFHKYRAD